MGSHRLWRAQAKKMRRKRIRQKIAQARDELSRKEQERKENSPKYQAWLSEQRALELFAEEEEARQSAEKNAAWLAEEDRAQKAWRDRQERLKLARAERAKQELRIKEEWEEEQRKLKEAKKEQDRIAEEKKLKQEELMRQIENFINKGGEMPPEVNVASVTNPDRPPCPFFTKTGACRFSDRCSRNHTKPAISRVLLVPGFYDHIGLRQMNPDELEAADDWLEYEDSETYHHFLDFYEDVLPEWERIGKISQFKVCCNFEPHLRGNVYIEYESAQDAVKAFKMFHGRFYGGKQINVEFVTIDSWKAAICGQFHKNCCPKGRSCNFLHVFRNPRNAFYAADRDHQDWRRKQQRERDRLQTPSPRRSRDRSWSGSPQSSQRRRDWRWSVSPSPPLERRSSDSVSSVRSHRSDRKDYSSRRESRRRDDYSRDRSRDRSRERSRNKARKVNEDKDSSRRERKRKSRNESYCGQRDLKNANESLASLAENSNRSQPSIDSTNKLMDKVLLNEGTENCEVINEKLRKDKKLKRESHRKEKRRKKRSHVRSSSSNSSDTN